MVVDYLPGFGLFALIAPFGAMVFVGFLGSAAGFFATGLRSAGCFGRRDFG